MSKLTALLLASTGEEATRIAKFCRKAFSEVLVHHGDWGMALPEECEWWQGDVIISYCSRWVVPKQLLTRASKCAINFHPAPPEYPGIGGINWALYNDAKSFGVTCHHMTPKVDAGQIIEVRRFPVLPADDVQSLFSRTHTHLETITYDILGSIANGQPLANSSEVWSGGVRSRVELNALATITYDMTPQEVTRRIRDANFGIWKPTKSAGGHVFELKSSAVVR